jgi:2-phospho-L-lactate guanylyltransferase
MATVVVPFRAGKSRLDLPEHDRTALALSMLEAVVSAAIRLGPTVVVTDAVAARRLAVRLGARVVADPGGGQGSAVAAGLATVASLPALVVNADLPLVTTDDLRALASSAPAFVAARDGTTNALALTDARAFRPLYGADSARRFAALGLRALELPNLARDVDTVADLEHLQLASATPS